MVKAKFTDLMLKKFKKLKGSRLICYLTDDINGGDISYCKKVKANYKLPKDYKIDEMDLDLARQVITTAKLVNLKFSYFNFSLIFLFLSILCGIVVVCIRGNIL